mgnify:CR=1 FL=1
MLFQEQVNAIHKFISAAYHCWEMRNFASAIAIVEGLENLLVGQLPVRINVEYKCTNLIKYFSHGRVYHQKVEPHSKS